MTVPDSFTIREARAGDVAALAAIEVQSFSDPWPESAFRDILRMQSARATVVVAANDVPLAYCVLIFAADQGEVANLAVAKDAQRQGLATRMLGDALVFAVTSKIVSVFLEVRESNLPARALYQSHQFREIGRRKRYYDKPPEDALVLQWIATT